MNRYARAFRITVWAGIVTNVALALPALFAPDGFLTALGFDPAYPNVWPRLAALMLILLSASYAAGANDPFRYRANAVLAVVARWSGAVFFAGVVVLLHFSTRFWLFALIDLAFAVPSAVFLALAYRRASPAPPISNPKEARHAEAAQAR